MASNILYEIKCDNCNKPLTLRFSRNDKAIMAYCDSLHDGCGKTFVIDSPSLELAFYRNCYNKKVDL